MARAPSTPLPNAPCDDVGNWFADPATAPGKKPRKG